MKELGVFCGTFNPVHWGHLLVAECARDQFKLDTVIFITCGRPPHRRGDLLDGESRHEMVAAALTDNPHFEASRMELDRPGPSYTVDTIEALRASSPAGARLNLIIGGDNLAYLPQWHRAEDLSRLCRFLVAPRMAPVAGNAEAQVQQKVVLPDGFDVAEIASPVVAVSSSEIRNRLRAEQSVLYMVPPAVNSILLARRHYRGSANPHPAGER